MGLSAVSDNYPILSALIAWGLAQIIKLPLDYLFTREIRWHLLFGSGGMPSSHSAMVAGLAWTIGLQEGFNSSIFAIACVVAIVVTYDATGVRRAAGNHARIINRMINDLLEHGHLLKEEALKEVLGHTPREVLAGTIFGVIVSGFAWWLLASFT